MTVQPKTEQLELELNSEAEPELESKPESKPQPQPESEPEATLLMTKNAPQQELSVGITEAASELES